MLFSCCPLSPPHLHLVCKWDKWNNYNFLMIIFIYFICRFYGMSQDQFHKYWLGDKFVLFKFGFHALEIRIPVTFSDGTYCCLSNAFHELYFEGYCLCFMLWREMEALMIVLTATNWFSSYLIQISLISSWNSQFSQMVLLPNSAFISVFLICPLFWSSRILIHFLSCYQSTPPPS